MRRRVSEGLVSVALRLGGARGARQQGRGGAQVEAEGLGKSFLAALRDGDGPAVAHAFDPAEREAAAGELGTDISGQVRPPLGPIDARPTEHAVPLAASLREVNSPG